MAQQGASDGDALPFPAGGALRLGDHAGKLEPVDDSSCRWHSPEGTVDWLAIQLALLGCDFTVHEPAELAHHLRTLGARMIRAVRKDSCHREWVLQTA